MSHFSVHAFICRDDNYGVLVHDEDTRTTISIDAPSAAAITTQLTLKGWTLTHILTTHHHIDHVEGHLALKNKTGCHIIGPEAEKDKIAGLDATLKGGDVLDLAGRRITIYDCPGHTLGHIAFHFVDDNLLFTGDTLFAMGCGRVFEGTLEQMFHSVNQFRHLPPETHLYCGHEYTSSNASFARAMEPGNRALQIRAADVRALRALGKLTCPSTIGDELKTNPFLRCDSPDIRTHLGMETASDAAVFAELRRRKNNFT